MKVITHLFFVCLFALGVHLPAHSKTIYIQESYALLSNSACFNGSWSDLILKSLVNKVSSDGLNVNPCTIFVSTLESTDDTEETLIALFNTYIFQLILGASLLLLIFIYLVMRLRLSILRQNQLKFENHLSSQYRSLVDNMPIVYYRKKVVNDKDFIFLDVNAAFEATFECTLEQVKNKRLSELLNSFKKLHYIYNNLGPNTFIVETKDGDKYFNNLIFNSKEKGTQDIFCIDNTKIYLAQIDIQEHNRELEKLYEKYRLVLHATELTPWTWDKRTELIECDFEYTPGKEKVEKNIVTFSSDYYYNVIHPDDRERIASVYDDLHAGRINILEQEYRVIYMPGDTKYNWAKSFAVVKERDKDSKPLVLVGASRQIDKQKALEHDLIESKEKAEESNRLKSAFLANISHEIRTPLNSIVGFSSQLINAEDENERALFVSLIETNNMLLLQLINDIVDLSTIEAGVLVVTESKVNLHKLFESVSQIAYHHINSNDVEFVIEEPSEEYLIYTDRDRLMQVVTNFILNAAKFTTKGVIKFGYYKQDSGDYYFYVSDTGCGIADEDRKRIFDRFVKLDPFTQGTGLGLSICEMIVLKLGGEIGVDSELGKGSTFWFTLPEKR